MNNGLADGSRLAEMMDGHITTQLIASAVRFGIPDLLGQNLTEGQLSEATGISPARLRRFLYALQRIGLVEPAGDGTYQNTSMARHLRRDTGALYGHALMAGRLYYDAWANLDDSLLSGQSVFASRAEGSLWAQLDNDTETAAAFTRTMRWNSERSLDEIIELYRFPESGVVADVGAGDGSVTAALLRRIPGLRAIVLEQPSVIGTTRHSLADRGVASRCTFVAGSFLEQVPEGAELYVLKSVLRNWDDDDALRILANCREAMTAPARLLLVEHAVDETDPAEAALTDLKMLVLFGSRDRTAADFGRLLRRGGFTVTGTWHGSAGLLLLEGSVQ